MNAASSDAKNAAGVTVDLLPQRFGIAGRELWDDPPLIAPPRELFIEVPNPERWGRRLPPTKLYLARANAHPR
jgi:hypothetical protein